MSVFSDEWRTCLREHFMYVIRNQDARTERSLITVMHETGFSDDELRELRIRATMHVDAMPEGYVPEMTFAESAPPQTAPALFAGVDVPQPEAAAEMPAADGYDEALEDDFAEDMDSLPEDALEEEAPPADEEEDDDAPQQLTMF